jgi:transcriptional regulator with XRE-family HTH domain
LKLKLQEALQRYNDEHPDDQLTQAVLGERIGTTQSLVNKHIKGRVIPGPSMLRRYSRVLGCSIDELFPRDQDMRGVA